MKRPALAALAVLAATAAQGQELILGAGYSDYSSEISEDGAKLAIEYHFRPGIERGRFALGWGGALAVQETEDIFIGIGGVATYDLDGPWRLELSVMPGGYFENEARNDLGSTFEIRSLFGVVYSFDSGNAVSLALSHKSNASTGDFNPGMNSVLVRWHMGF